MISGLEECLSCPQQGAGLHQVEAVLAPWGSQVMTEIASTPRQALHVIEKRMVMATPLVKRASWPGEAKTACMTEGLQGLGNRNVEINQPR
jgi:hypothetical protein